MKTVTGLVTLVTFVLNTRPSESSCSTSLIDLDLLNQNWYSIIWNAFKDAVLQNDEEGMTVGGSSTFSTSDCGDICSAAEYDLTASLTVDPDLLASVGIELSDFEQYTFGLVDLDSTSETLTVQAAIDFEFCGSEALCAAVFGTDYQDSCTTMDMNFDLYVPTDCNVAGYNAFSMSYGYSYSFMCCSTSDCNSGFFDNSPTCDSETVSSTASLASAVSSCWNEISQDFSSYLVCEAPSALAEIPSTCTTSWTSDCAAYVDTCTQDVLDMLSTFGSCLCSSAPSDDFGEMIGTFMEFMYSGVCEGLTMECSSSGVNLISTSTFLEFVMGFAADVSSGIDDIKTILSSMGDIGEDYIDLEVNGTSVAVYIRTSGEDIAEAIETTMFGSSGNDFISNYETAVTDTSSELSNQALVATVDSVSDPVVEEDTRTVSEGSSSSGGGSDDDEVDIGLIVGICGGVVGLILIVVVAMICMRQNKKKQASTTGNKVATEVNAVNMVQVTGAPNGTNNVQVSQNTAVQTQQGMVMNGQNVQVPPQGPVQTTYAQRGGYAGGGMRGGYGPNAVVGGGGHGGGVPMRGY